MRSQYISPPTSLCYIWRTGQRLGSGPATGAGIRVGGEPRDQRFGGWNLQNSQCVTEWWFQKCLFSSLLVFAEMIQIDVAHIF